MKILEKVEKYLLTNGFIKIEKRNFIYRHEPPEDMSPFDSKLVAKQIEKIYDEMSKM